jgi:YHS domain-containing protein
MKKIALAVLAAFAISGVAYADSCCPSHAKKTEDKAAVAPAAKAEKKAAAKVSGAKTEKIVALNNTACPVTGQPVGSMEAGAKMVYKGTEIGLCCSGCKNKFMQDAEANLKKARETAKK